jgi:hypothetical protein
VSVTMVSSDGTCDWFRLYPGACIRNMTSLDVAGTVCPKRQRTSFDRTSALPRHHPPRNPPEGYLPAAPEPDQPDRHRFGTTALNGAPAANIEPSPALSLIPSEPGPIAGRVVGILATDGVAAAGLAAVRSSLERADAVSVIIAPIAASSPAWTARSR